MLLVHPMIMKLSLPRSKASWPRWPECEAGKRAKLTPGLVVISLPFGDTGFSVLQRIKGF